MEESLHVFSVTYKKDLDKGKLAKFITFGEVPLGSASSDKNSICFPDLKVKLRNV